MNTIREEVAAFVAARINQVAKSMEALTPIQILTAPSSLIDWLKTTRDEIVDDFCDYVMDRMEDWFEPKPHEPTDVEEAPNNGGALF